MTQSKEIFVVLGNQLFPPKHLDDFLDTPVFMAEDYGLCTYVRHHKQKIVLFLAAMRSYRDELENRDFKVHYEPLVGKANRLNKSSYEQKLGRFVKSTKPNSIVMWEIEDKPFEDRMVDFATAHGLTIRFLPSPMFLTDRETFADWLASNRPFMAEFYKMQRRRLGILMEVDDKPRGGRWSFDDENRKPLPASVDVPGMPRSTATEHVETVAAIVDSVFSDHPGALSVQGWWMPTTRKSALAWVRKFIDERLESFGPYEDALSTRDPLLYHSGITPVLNIGLITPQEVLDRVLTQAEAHGVPINSLEGFVRQIIGWREFVRGIYRHYSARQEKSNFFKHQRSLTDAWYNGTTGLPPLDDAINKTVQLGWAHHIERLMVIGNLMNLCEIAPRHVHTWFMEMFVDSSEWVMGPNVYGMALFSDGGIFATKPYICGSNYILKMSDYKKPRANPDGTPTWCDIIDGLYWRFIEKNRDFFAGQHRLSRMVGTLDRMNPDRRAKIIAAADDFTHRTTK